MINIKKGKVIMLDDRCKKFGELERMQLLKNIKRLSKLWHEKSMKAKVPGWWYDEKTGLWWGRCMIMPIKAIKKEKNMIEITPEDMKKVVEVVSEMSDQYSDLSKQNFESLEKLKEKYCTPPTLNQKEAEEKARTHWIEGIVNATTKSMPQTLFNGEAYRYDWDRIIKEKSIPCKDYRVVCQQKTKMDTMKLWELQRDKYTGNAISISANDYNFKDGKIDENDSPNRVTVRAINGDWAIEILLPPEITD